MFQHLAESKVSNTQAYINGFYFHWPIGYVALTALIDFRLLLTLLLLLFLLLLRSVQTYNHGGRYRVFRISVHCLVLPLICPTLI